ncbi:Golgi membrane exchange factor (Ric1p-Rgp1p) subunit [Xanthoria calcicola]
MHDLLAEFAKCKLPPSNRMSNIRLSIEWDKAAVYAGENVDCVITFKNVAQAPILHRTASQTNSLRERWKDNTAAHVRQQKSGHSPSYSSSISLGHKHRKAVSHDPTWSAIPASPKVQTREEAQNEESTAGRKHRRSVSIVSIGGEKSSSTIPFHATSTSLQPGRGHGRAGSLRALSEKSTMLDHGPRSSVHSKRSGPTQLKGYSQAQNDKAVATKSSLARSSSSPMIKERLSPRTLCSLDKTAASPIFKSHNQTAFPNSLNSTRTPGLLGRSDSADGLNTRMAQTQSAREDPPHGILPGSISSTTTDDTPRGSTDLESFGSNSSDTMASEYVIQEPSRFHHHPGSMRQHSHHASFEASQVPETLMMGYGNITGSFHLDPSLVDASYFHEVKRKAVVGNEGGGGVVRAESNKRQSGLLGSLGWNTLGESLEGLLGKREVSSIKGATNASAAKWMPILSSPQSLLFVDLRLEPGQSQSYSYSFRLPAGIPPSYRGKAVKFAYNIVIGVQRATRSRQPHIVRRIDFPFRVLPCVNNRGETMGHDLMSPHIMLHNEPLVLALNKDEGKGAFSTEKSMQITDPSAEGEFLSYMKQLLETSRRDSSLGLLSPSAARAKSPMDTRNEATTMEAAISFAIQQSNSAMPSKLSANRFEITRSGLRVAMIMLARPAYRLGEIVPVVVDLHASEFQCFALRASLETSEHLDPAVALRSPASLLRASRRIYATQHETTTSADRVFFSLAVPSNSTPEFVTSAVNLQWRLRFEFVTSNQAVRGTVGHGAIPDILENVAEDERGTVSVAVEAMPCETFEVTLPLQIYGGISLLEESYLQSRRWLDIA